MEESTVAASAGCTRGPVLRAQGASQGLMLSESSGARPILVQWPVVLEKPLAPWAPWPSEGHSVDL